MQVAGMYVSRTVCVNRRERGEIYMGAEGTPWPCKRAKKHEIKGEWRGTED